MTDTRTIDPTDVYNLARRWYADELAGWDYLPSEWRTAESGLTLAEYIEQSLDGSSTVIYTHTAKLVLLASDNEDAYADEIGEAAPNVSAAAYMALRTDVFERLDAQGVDLSAEEPADSEEDGAS